jgi:hypothetical protein
MPLATGGETTVLNALLAARFVSLHTANPAPSGGGEVTGGAYARQSATFTNTGNNPTVAANSVAIQFPVATASWGTITHFALWSAASGGTFLAYNNVATPKTIDVDDIARWEIGAMTVTTD